MLPLIRRRHALLAVVVLLAAAGFALAGDPDTAPAPGAQGDPPNRVARLNYISGQVSFRPASLDDWGVATLNYPLTTGDHLWTEREASAELHVGSSVVRLAPETAFAFLNLDDNVVQARVAEGTIDVRVREILGGEGYEVDTPNVAISILAPGTYRIDVDPEGDRTRVTVRAGEVEVSGNGRTFSVYPGQMAEIIGIDDITYDLGRAPSPDRWELWCRDRDRREDNRVALNYVSRDMIGYEDLDDYGTWSYVPEYGYAWQPTVVAVDWAPYRYGHWAFVRPWGWTWIDNARWGFAPFHYGRWACYRSRWIWVPGHRMMRPVWAPALVAFVGGRNWNFAFGFGVRPAVGWFPLAPGELYCPSYRASRVYLRNLNVMNVNVTNINVTAINVAGLRYANRGVPGAMTAVPRDIFVGSQSVQRVGVAVPRYAAEQTPIAGHAAEVAPDATSVLGHVPAAAARPPASVMQRAVVARTEPPAAGTRNAPVTTLSQRSRRAAAQPDTPQVVSPGLAGTDSRGGITARPRPDENSAGVDAPAARPRDEGSAASDWRRSRSDAGNDRPPASRTDIYVAPRTEQSQPDRAAAPAVRSRSSEPSGGWRPAPGTADTPTPRVQQNERAIENTPAPSSERATPRTERPAPSSERSAPRDERPAPSSERSAPRDERPAPSGGIREAPASDHSARPRTDDRPAAPARADRPAAPATSPALSAKPADRAPERPQPQASGGRGGQSEGTARPRGGRGGDK